jgi:energy-coupling factor transporter ATP-binding protein EcfA2
MTPTRVGRPPRVNPFSTRFVAPGAIPFRFPTEDGLAELVRRLEAGGGRGQIVGPHGSGKSTLLTALLPALTSWHVRVVHLNTSDRRLPAWAWGVPPPRSLLVIDGFEQLGRVTRWRVKRRYRRSGSGLLVTAHTPVGLPDLYRTDVTPEAAAAVIASLVPAGGEWVLDGFDVGTRLRAHRGSLREVLFELYDRWEAGKGG